MRSLTWIGVVGACPPTLTQIVLNNLDHELDLAFNDRHAAPPCGTRWPLYYQAFFTGQKIAQSPLLERLDFVAHEHAVE